MSLENQRKRRKQIICRALRDGALAAILFSVLAAIFLTTAFITPHQQEWTKVTDTYVASDITSSLSRRSGRVLVIRTSGDRFRLQSSSDYSIDAMKSELKPGDVLTISYYPWILGNRVCSFEYGGKVYLNGDETRKEIEEDRLFLFAIGWINLGLTMLSLSVPFLFYIKEFRDCRRLIKKFKNKQADNE